MAIKVKELKDDAQINITVNKSFYLMAKAASFTILNSLNVNHKGDAYFKELMTKNYEDLNDTERAFYTIILLLAEIEKQATENKLYMEKEILEPTDPGFIEPKQD
jgi:menaquinone-dependent protoporphyrinogen IX oxidase